MNLPISIAEIYQAHHKMVFNLALQYVQNWEDAEEITQDTFVKIYNGLNDFSQQSNLKTWIYRITINQSLDFIKSRNAQKRSFLQQILRLSDPSFNREPAHFNHPGIELEQKEATQVIFHAINQLSDKQKTAIILTKIDGKSLKEVAEIMNTNVKAVESLLHRAKKTLEKQLNRKG